MKRNLRRAAWILGALLAAAVVLVLVRAASRADPQRAEETWRKPEPLEPAEKIYDGKLGEGWDDWGWGPHELGHGPAKVVFENYGGIVLHHGELAGPFGGLTFRFLAPVEYGDFLQASLRGAGLPDEAFPTVAIERRHIVGLTEGWREVLVRWSELNPEHRPFDRVMISSRASAGPASVLLDRIWLTKPQGKPSEERGSQKARLRVLCDQEAQPINPLVYGGSSAAWDMGQTAQRLGGNPMTRFNWELGAWNVGKDWYFENIKLEQGLFEQLSVAAKDARSIALVVPMIGWVAKDGSSFGFPRSLAADQQAFDPYKPDAGNGVHANGELVQPGDPSRTSVPAPPELIEKWVRRIVTEAQARGRRTVHTYILDNEPSLWNSTHRDVHPQPVSYDELLERTVMYATAIRNADPEAVIAGPAEWGWLGYQESGLDRVAGKESQDRKAHGDVPLVAWYLQKLAEHERATGARLLDMLDLHFYPAAAGIYDGARTDSAGRALRHRSTRGLWDPTYRDESWIGQPIQLLPRMKAWIRENYPGRGVMIGEWSFGADQHISGGLAAAEALGRFGRHGADAAYFWGQPTQQSPVYWAFRAFRNFDGRGARFEDLTVPVAEAEGVSLFASRNQDTSRMVLISVHPDAMSGTLARIDLQECGVVQDARAFTYEGKPGGLAPGKVTRDGGSLSVDLAPSSITVVELSLRR